MDPIEELKEKKILLLSGGWSAERGSLNKIGRSSF